MGKSKFTFQLVGVNNLVKKLKSVEQGIADKAAFRLQEFVKEVNSDQVTRTPVDLGPLRSGNDFRGNKLDWELFNTKEYAPYVEFGTGALVKVPKGLEDYAIQFKGAGVREVNLPARPFFFEPFLRRRKALIQQLKKDLVK